MRNHGDKYPVRAGFKHSTSRLQAPVDTNVIPELAYITVRLGLGCHNLRNTFRVSWKILCFLGELRVIVMNCFANGASSSILGGVASIREGGRGSPHKRASRKRCRYRTHRLNNIFACGGGGG